MTVAVTGTLGQAAVTAALLWAAWFVLRVTRGTFHSVGWWWSGVKRDREAAAKWRQLETDREDRAFERRHKRRRRKT